MLLLHETHRVVGSSADDFDAAFRDELIPALGKNDDARLLWYLHHAHGTGPSYTVVTITALRDEDVWDPVHQRFETGDLHSLAAELEGMRHDHKTKFLAPLQWSAFQDVAFEEVPVDGSTHPLTLYMEDTVWPYPGKFDEYVDAAGTLYARDTIGRRIADGTSLLELRGAFRKLAGPKDQREVVLWQRVLRPEFLVALLTMEIPAEHRGPGTWMKEALAYRDNWESRLLRTAAWSPLD